MAFIFPEDKKDFVAPNGVTYTFDGAKWVTKAFKADESAFEKIETDIQVLNQKVDFNAEEAVTDRDRQDAALDDYKAEVTLQQEEQDQELVDYKAEVASQQEAQDDALTEHIALVATEQAAQDLALAEFKVEVGDSQTAQDEALDEFKSEYEQNKVDVAAEQAAQDVRLAALESSGGGDPFDPDLLKAYVTQDQLDLSQEAQDDRIQALEDAPQVSILDDLLDVDLSPVKRKTKAGGENTTVWIYYRTDVKEGNWGNNGAKLKVNKFGWGFSNTSELISRCEPGSTLNLYALFVGQHFDEYCKVVEVKSVGTCYEIEFESEPDLIKAAREYGRDTDVANLNMSYVPAGEVPDPGAPDPDPDPDPDPLPPAGDAPVVEDGVFLGYDGDRKVWVPQKLEKAESVDPDNYYDKAEVDAKIDAIDVDVELDGYYTKDEVDASQKAQDDRIDALAAGGGGGSVELSNYYTKDETYDKRSVDNMMGIEQGYRATGDSNLQDQIDELKANSGGSGKDLEPQVNTNSAGILKNKQDIEAFNDDQTRQDRAIGDLDLAVTQGLASRYTKDEVDELFDGIEETNTDNLMAKDERNVVTTAWRLAGGPNGNTTFISTDGNELGLYHVKTPQQGVHAANMQYVDDQDAVTLQSAKDYTDAQQPDTYTKSEVDESQATQDAIAAELAVNVAAISGKVDENIVDIHALEATNVSSLNDLTDVSMSTRAVWKKRDGLTDTVGQEELNYSTQFKGWKDDPDRIPEKGWCVKNGRLTLSKTAEFGNEVDDLFANMLVGNKVYLQANHANLNLPKSPDRAHITEVTDLGDKWQYRFDDDLSELETYMGRTWGTDTEATIQVALSEIVVVPDVPEEPGDPTKRSDVVLGYDKGTKLWTPHLADYLPIDGGTLTNTISMRKGSKDYNQFTIAPNSGEDYSTNIYARNGGQMRFRTTPDKNADQNYETHIVLNGAEQTTKIYKLADPSHDEHAVNLRYLSRWLNAPARMSWLWGGEKSSSAAPGNKSFYYHPGGNNGIQGYMRFSFKTQNGCDIGDGKFSDTNVQIDNGPVGTIWQFRTDVKKWKLIMQFRIKSWRWNFNNHFEFGLSSLNGRPFTDMGSNVEYWVTIGGFF